MRKAQEAAKASTAYAHMANEILTYLGGQEITNEHAMYKVRHVKRRMLIVVSSDKGLAGAYNSNIMRRYMHDLKSDDAVRIGNVTLAIGRKIGAFATRLKDTEVVGVYDSIETEEPYGRDLNAIVETAVTEFTEGNVDAVDVIYTKFHNSVNQTVETMRVLPAGYTYTEVSETIRTAEYEPNPEAVLDAVTYRLIESQILQAVLDSLASEHSMRMVAMKNATDNASDIASDLTLEMNKARQSAITQELAEISGGVEAMKE